MLRRKIRDKFNYLYFRSKLVQRIELFILSRIDLTSTNGVRVQMFCPECRQRLHLLPHAIRYENLDEHVSDSNEDEALPYKPAFGCTNPDCTFFFIREDDWDKRGAFFDPWGAIYNIPKGFRPAGEENYPSALCSGNWRSDKAIEKSAKRRKKRSLA